MTTETAAALTAEDLYALDFASDPHVAPDAATVYAVVHRADAEAGGPGVPGYRGRIVAHDTSGGAVKDVTHAPGRYAQPRVSPDGTTLAFLSDRDPSTKGMQLWTMPTDGGEACRRTALVGGVSTFAWRPDSGAIALVGRDAAHGRPEGGAPLVVDRTYYKQDGAGFRTSTSARVLLLELAGGDLRVAAAPAGDPHAVAWHPDGRTLLFSAPRTLADEGFYHRTLWRVSLDGGEEPVDLVRQDDPLILDAPTLSPDGGTVAYLAPIDPTSISSPTGVWTVATGGGTPTQVCDVDAVSLVSGDARYGRYPGGPAWLDDATLLVNLNRRGSSRLCRLSLDGAFEPLTEAGRAVTAFDAAAGAVAFVAETPDRPGEVYLRPADLDGAERRLSHLNDAFVERFAPVAPSPVRRVATRDGEEEIEYWVLSPRAARADGAMVLQVHGGPRTNYGYGFSFEFQLLAARGYAVVYGNPRGGSSYGRTFADAISGRLGTIDADDVMTIADDARARHGVDGAPMHLTGGSYGGFMTNWLVTSTDTFASAVTQRSITNWLSFWGTSDIGFSWIHVETGSRPWEDPMRMWEMSPLKHVDRVRTPLLILHAEEDHRCPIEQAEQFHTALSYLGREVAFVRYPDEGHDLSRSGRPDRRIDRLERIAGWFDAHAPASRG